MTGFDPIDLAPCQIAYAQLDADLFVREVGGCMELWGDVCGQRVTAALPELHGLQRTLAETVDAGEAWVIPLINRVCSGSTRFLDVIIQPRGDGSGGSTVWLVSTAAPARAAESRARGLTTRAAVGAFVDRLRVAIDTRIDVGQGPNAANMLTRSRSSVGFGM